MGARFGQNFARTFPLFRGDVEESWRMLMPAL